MSAEGLQRKNRPLAFVPLASIALGGTRVSRPVCLWLLPDAALPLSFAVPTVLLWKGLPSWKNWSTLRKPVVQVVQKKNFALAGGAIRSEEGAAAMLKAGIVGAAGYAGAELVRILLRHPDFGLRVITSNSDAGVVT